MTIRTRAAELLHRIVKGNPTGTSLHVPVPMGTEDDEKKKQRRKDVAKLVRSAAGEVAKAGEVDPGMYIGRMVLNHDELARWWDTTRFHMSEPELDPFPHVTIVYSLATFDWKQDRSILVVSPVPGPDTFSLLGPKNAVVLHLACPLLESRWAAAVKAGAKVTYDSFKPHCTLFYLGAGYDSTSWRDGSTGSIVTPPDLVLGPEIIGPLGNDVYPAVDAPDWYRESRGVIV